MDLTPPVLVACHQGEQYRRMVDVLVASAAEHCPGWALRVEETRIKGGQGSKLKYWNDVVQSSPDGARLLLIDADTVITGPLDDIWTQPFDVAITLRDPRHSPWPNNAGVVFVRVSPAVKRWVAEWLKRTVWLWQRAPSGTRRVARKRFGALDQFAMDRTLAFKRHLRVLKLPCRVWNCEDSEWIRFDPDVTKIVHVKGSLRRALFGGKVSVRRAPQLPPLVELWRAYEAKALAGRAA